MAVARSAGALTAWIGWALLAVLAARAHPALETTSIDPPAPPGSRCPALAAEGPTTVDGHEILMTWLEPGETGGRLRFARLSGRAWSPPVTIAEPVSPEPEDRPSLTVVDTQSVRRTLIARTGDVVARSGDGGRTWASLPAPALPFASFAGGDEAGYAFWLAAERDGSARLLGTRILAGETLLDPDVAGGSGTSAAMTWDGPVVAYRDRGAEGTEIIAIVRREEARWTLPQVLHAGGSRPAPEPDPGPQVAALGRRVAVAWSAETSSRPRVLVAFSSDAARTFGAPVEVGSGAGAPVPRSPVGVALDENGQALVLWLVAAGSAGASLDLARVSPDGSQGEQLVVARGLRAPSGGAPQIARAGDRLAIAWSEGDPSRLRAVVVPLAAVPAAGRPGSVVASSAAEAYSSRGRLGDAVPELELVSLSHDKVSLASLRGRVVLLNLWATWCLPCFAEMPELAALGERYRGEGLVVVGVSVDDAERASAVRALVSELGISYSVWLDPAMDVYRALRAEGLPTTFVIDRGGRIVLRRDGRITTDDPELGEALRRALRDS